MDQNTIITVAFLVFGAVILICEFVVLALKKQGFGPQAVRIIGITMIVIVAAALSVTTMSLDRLTPVIGLLGTLAGYLAGRGEGKAE